MKTAVRRSVAVVSVGAALLLSGACSFDFSLGAVSVDSGTVAEVVETQLTAELGQSPGDVTCPENLPAEVGAEIRCELDTGGEVYGVTVTATSVEGTDVNFDILVDEQPMG
ncbi:DUF4333 domain-containing protein [Thermobifida halotolerans]|nr:DUF4333 domain-containing protein [Thermobifida halotolerans]